MFSQFQGVHRKEDEATCGFQSISPLEQKKFKDNNRLKSQHERMRKSRKCGRQRRKQSPPKNKQNTNMLQQYRDVKLIHQNFLDDIFRPTARIQIDDFQMVELMK
jgi:hypothetical protein